MNNIRNNSILKYGLIVVMLSFAINVIFYMQFSLDETVFLKHYYERDIHDGSFMIIHFISNSNDNRKINEISFPQMPEDFASVVFNNFSNNFDNGYYRSENFAHYSYNELMIEFRYNDKNYDEENNEKSIVLNKAVIKYNNGDVQEVDIGKIVLHKNMNYYDFIDSNYSSSSNDFTASTVMESQKNIIIEKIESELDKETSGFMELKLNGVKTEELKYPISVNMGDSLYFDNKFLYYLDDMRKYNVYDVEKRLLISDSEGNKGYEIIGNLDYYPIELFLTEKGISEFLEYIGVK